MTYLPKSNGSDDENADQAEELEVRLSEIFDYAAKELSAVILHPWWNNTVIQRSSHMQ